MIEEFRGEYRFLSNFYVEPDGTTAEHDFQSEKATRFEQKLWVLSADNPRLAKERGRLVPLVDGWRGDKDLHAMRGVLARKFTEHHELAERLVATGDQELQEGNRWGDDYWGRVWMGDEWRGENHLGRLLMELRDDLGRYMP